MAFVVLKSVPIYAKVVYTDEWLVSLTFFFRMIGPQARKRGIQYNVEPHRLYGKVCSEIPEEVP